MDALLLSRVQFALTTVYHFLFVPVTLGLSIFVALLETGSLVTKTYAMRDRLRKLAKFFGGLFLINFAMGVVTGIVQEFHFGMNWSEYSRFMGDIFGAPLALEALTAFFLESTFLGLWMFGWDRLSPKLHCLTIWIVALGSNLSAFWILTANSFMQHPVGYAISNGRAEMTDFLALVTNPYVHGEFGHTLLAGVSTAGFLVLAISAWKLLYDRESRAAFELSLKAAVVYTLVGLMGTMGVGHFHTQYLAEANPMKLSAMEALWETENPAPFTVMAVINEDEHKNDMAIEIPALFSFMLYNKPEGEVKGMNDLHQELVAKYGQGDYYPDVTGLFFSFRIMIGAGGLMAAITALLGLLAWRRKLLDFPIVLKLVQVLFFLPFIANSVGWYIAEAGRQPWIVVGLQKTADAVSPNLTAGEVGLTIAGFTAVYLVLIAVAVGIGFRHIYNTKIAED
ncbi:MAG: cytochrome ubiquinol oxidase subunit I [Selenomonadaceae bacterium]|nr:cytochrome ubiquinol oxidase subunit I [Selenomonadaceae bacterium]MBQ5586688.1 cytochrome ubiquinol oxidase subunit I [Selenomonadaceae bacterium]MBR0329169.1 cytochrome ubiquinol oxidase subunit I [Selenomonadaceae bacterium]